ncbi:MAG: peptidase [Nevskia sp.]|nr:peptidase [Nevskia sp.]
MVRRLLMNSSARGERQGMGYARFALTTLLVTLSVLPAFAGTDSQTSKSRHQASKAIQLARTQQRQAVAIPASYVLKDARPAPAPTASAALGLDAPAMQADLSQWAPRGDDADRLHDSAVSVKADARVSANAANAAKAAKPVLTPKSNDDAPELVAKAGVVSKKGMRSLAQAGVPQPVMAQLAEAFSHDSVVHGVPPEHAAFRVVYEQVASGRARRKHPELRLASVTISGREHRIYRYAVEHDAVAFVDGSGRGVMPLDLASPVPGAPITSPFGWRMHPILEIRKFHEGVDFGAPTGTPVRAADDGTVEDVGLRGNYGNYVRVRHSAQLQTAYAHLDGFAPGLHAGSHVQRGQVIAYIGTTGWATGPHLYYEVIVDGEHLDPLRHDLALHVQLEGAALRRFKQYTDLLATRSRPNVNKACLLPLCKGSKDLG